VTGKVPVKQVKQNKDGLANDLLYLTKPLGIGLVTTAQKKKMAEEADLKVAKASMLKLNKVGQELAKLPYVHALTDVTGFGLAGHLLEICDASNLAAMVRLDEAPVFDFAHKYIELNCLPGGTHRNWHTYGHRFSLQDEDQFKILADPQTSGGLLITVDHLHQEAFEAFMKEQGYELSPFGVLTHPQEAGIAVHVGEQV
jgi:selenide,water dikinase